ncbi:hypothetical protein D0U04_18960 [Bacillus clarus]|uniref:Uncharacterized protein n=1 Tax=Bacillus clarus TaxID=2338372 RepID=A0ABX9KTQ9_9BACI|nr:hypothetical protein D0U04_18960 [Bacillus clarus]
MPHRHQSKKYKYPHKTRKLTTSCEIVHFFCFRRYKILKLMDVYDAPITPVHFFTCKIIFFKEDNPI